MERNGHLQWRIAFPACAHCSRWVFLPATLGAQVLPPPSALPDQAPKLPVETHLFVREYRFRATPRSAAELARVTEPFTSREISSEQLKKRGEPSACVTSITATSTPGQ